MEDSAVNRLQQYAVCSYDLYTFLNDASGDFRSNKNFQMRAIEFITKKFSLDISTIDRTKTIELLAPKFRVFTNRIRRQKKKRSGIKMAEFLSNLHFEFTELTVAFNALADKHVKMATEIENLRKKNYNLSAQLLNAHISEQENNRLKSELNAMKKKYEILRKANRIAGGRGKSKAHQIGTKFYSYASKRRQKKQFISKLKFALSDLQTPEMKIKYRTPLNFHTEMIFI